MRIDDISNEVAAGKTLEEIFASLACHRIATVNWPSEYPYAPNVLFSIVHDTQALYLKYFVDEQCTQARVTEDAGEIWTDSCVEFFVAFDDTGYYNFEFNCIGTALLSFRKEKPFPQHASPEVLKSIRRYPSLPVMPFEEIDAPDNSWSLMVRIPKEAFFKHSIESLKGIEARANFYKCGDHLSKVHFLSWNPIDTPTPNFHVPQFFSKIQFL